MYLVKSKDTSLRESIKENTLEINFFEKVKLLTNIFPNKKMKIFFKKGNEKLEPKLDIMNIVKQHSRHQNNLNEDQGYEAWYQSSF